MSGGVGAARPRTPWAMTIALAARRAVGAPMRIWRRSMRVRTVLITLLLSSIALIVVGTVVSYTIAHGLFEDRKNQVLAESARATSAAQKIASSNPSTDVTALSSVRESAIASVQTAARPAGLEWTATGTVEGRSTGGAVQLISDDLRSAVAQDPQVQHWQSIAIRDGGGDAHPGIAVGDTVRFNGGRAELYLVYDIGDVQTTLSVVQRALLIGGLVLLLLIGAVAAVVASLVIAPLKQAAAVSEQLAAGDLARRIPERGTDAVAVLARSFNRMADSLQRQISQLANLSRVQQRFVSDVSHELRTPLTTIRLASDVLHAGRGRYDAPTARSAELLRAQVQRFETLLADLLEISRMDAHAADVSGEPTNLVDLARESIDALGNLAEETGSVVRLSAPGGHADVDVDARRIARIVRNLLSNALEHGEGRPIEVLIDSSATAVALGVRDHGVGLAEADVQRVFDRFWRADPSRQRRVGGTGLGLAISLEDAVLHGGALEVWSRAGDGAHFVLTLPRPDRLRDVDGGAALADLDRPVPLRPADAAVEPAPPRRASSRVPA